MNDPLSVTCPFCGAKTGKECHTPSGKLLPGGLGHKKRRIEANKPIVTKTGKVLTDDDIQELADEAEAGYDVSHLTKGNQEKLDVLPYVRFDQYTKPKKKAKKDKGKKKSKSKKGKK